MTPLQTSLLSCLRSPTTLMPELISDIAEDNNPRRVKSEKENTAYWVQKDGTPVLIFPAVLDTQGKYGRTGPYFNMIENVNVFRWLLRPTSSDILTPSQRQTKTILNGWRLCLSLRSSERMICYIPPRPRKFLARCGCCWACYVEKSRISETMVCFLCINNLNYNFYNFFFWTPFEGLTSEQNAAVTEFWKADKILVVVSDPLFDGMGDPSKIDTPKISRSQLSSE